MAATLHPASTSSIDTTSALVSADFNPMVEALVDLGGAGGRVAVLEAGRLTETTGDARYLQLANTGTFATDAELVSGLAEKAALPTWPQWPPRAPTLT